MGAIKDNLYYADEQNIALTARAISHPARVKILKFLNVFDLGITNTELAKKLNFSRPNVKNHLSMMKEADLIEFHYFTHYYCIQLNKNGKSLAKMIFEEG